MLKRVITILDVGIPKKVMTPEVHKDYIHICGHTGDYLEKVDLCRNCERIQECGKDHAVRGWDW